MRGTTRGGIVARDITKRKETERLQQLLIAELSHRVKNTLATVQSIANQTVRLAKSPGDFAASFGGRLQALLRFRRLRRQAAIGWAAGRHGDQPPTSRIADRIRPSGGSPMKEAS